HPLLSPLLRRLLTILSCLSARRIPLSSHYYNLHILIPEHLLSASLRLPIFPTVRRALSPLSTRLRRWSGDWISRWTTRRMNIHLSISYQCNENEYCDLHCPILLIICNR
ncbi:hypothetical protein PMAYCL1PPCAC_31144, partial [Pristionchus mayeri]